MSLVLIVYLFGVFSNLTVGLGLAVALIGITILITVAVGSMNYYDNSYKEYDDDDDITLYDYLNTLKLKSLITVFVLLSTILMMIPSEKTMYLMIGAYGVESITEIEGVKELPENVVLVMNNFLKEYAAKKN